MIHAGYKRNGDMIVFNLKGTELNFQIYCHMR